MNNISTNPSHQPGPDEKVVRRALGLYVIGLASRRYTNNLADRYVYGIGHPSRSIIVR